MSAGLRPVGGLSRAGDVKASTCASVFAVSSVVPLGRTYIESSDRRDYIRPPYPFR